MKYVIFPITLLASLVSNLPSGNATVGETTASDRVAQLRDAKAREISIRLGRLGEHLRANEKIEMSGKWAQWSNWYNWGNY